MVRNSKKKALYEVIIGARSKPGYEQLHSKITEQETTEQPKPGSESSPSVVRWVRKPRLVELNAGRIEFSIPYQIGIAVALGVLLVLIVVFRLGEWSGSRVLVRTNAAAQPAREEPRAVQPAATFPASNVSAGSVPQTTTVEGKNRIVIQTYQGRSQLEPVKEYFDRAGVATEILERNSWYYLVTKNRYENIDKAGSDGFLAKQKIIELGAGYRAPAGYETFRKPGAAGPFSDAFGMKFED